MKIITAFDSYKNCLEASDVCHFFAGGWKAKRPGDEIIEIPLSDGGEGFSASAVKNLNAEKKTVKVTGPLGGEVTAAFAVADGYAFTEMAQASGIELVPDGELDALRASTYGFGELLRRIAEEEGVKEIICGIGGSATSDGGLGCAQALGWKFFDAAGKVIPDGAGAAGLLKIASMMPPEELDLPLIRVACDVDNPLTGPNGAAQVYSPQKGAGPDDVALIEKGLMLWSRLWNSSGSMPGDGAAGGLGFFLRNGLKAVIAPGAEIALELADFDRFCSDTALVVTGEGASDSQTLCGKLPVAVARSAHRNGAFCILVSGKIAETEALLKEFDGVYSISSGPGSVADAIASAPENLYALGASIAGTVSGVKNK